jgi:hypothetical protein
MILLASKELESPLGLEIFSSFVFIGFLKDKIFLFLFPLYPALLLYSGHA